jgi:hypothetical protein
MFSDNVKRRSREELKFINGSARASAEALDNFREDAEKRKTKET